MDCVTLRLPRTAIAPETIPIIPAPERISRRDEGQIYVSRILVGHHRVVSANRFLGHRLFLRLYAGLDALGGNCFCRRIRLPRSRSATQAPILAVQTRRENLRRRRSRLGNWMVVYRRCHLARVAAGLGTVAASVPVPSTQSPGQADLPRTAVVVSAKIWLKIHCLRPNFESNRSSHVVTGTRSPGSRRETL